MQPSMADPGPFKTFLNSKLSRLLTLLFSEAAILALAPAAQPAPASPTHPPPPAHPPTNALTDTLAHPPAPPTGWKGLCKVLPGSKLSGF